MPKEPFRFLERNAWFDIEIPDWRTIEITKKYHPELYELQQKLASEGLKDPWLRNYAHMVDRRVIFYPNKWEYIKKFFGVPTWKYAISLTAFLVIADKFIWPKNSADPTSEVGWIGLKRMSVRVLRFLLNPSRRSRPSWLGQGQIAGMALYRKYERFDPAFAEEVNEISAERALKPLERRSFLRNYAPYQPPSNTVDMILQAFYDVYQLKRRRNIPDTSLFDHVLNLNSDGTTNSNLKFQFLSKLAKLFRHKVPNSQLVHTTTLRDVVEFYQTPVDTRHPLKALGDLSNLPPNLHVEQEYTIFHPDTDRMFKGISATPGVPRIFEDTRMRRQFPDYLPSLVDMEDDLN
ncbi:unnamed protein product [Cyprideis torosa]|uniref:Large ribosomal subunit protein mL50 n=1 Tax=Cyprideis torosa TaxID=163714 RepID=A0A7R8WHC0_9CRUS|nr:unnamed protein product [Cyprideis torosa]CAG0899180.1 unnamed protein product [Cyprideis torosa]